MLVLLVFSFSSIDAVFEEVASGDVELAIDAIPDDDKLWLLLLILLALPLQSSGVWLVEAVDEVDVLSLLLVDVVTIELVEEDKDDSDSTADCGGGKVFGLTGYL